MRSNLSRRDALLNQIRSSYRPGAPVPMHVDETTALLEAALEAARAAMMERFSELNQACATIENQAAAISTGKMKRAG